MKTRTPLLFFILLITVLALPYQNVTAGGPLCVKPGGVDSCYATIQGAIDAALVNETIYVYPGTYNETAANRTILTGSSVQQGSYQFGLFLPNSKPGLSLVGVDTSGTPITDPNSPDLPYITTNATNNFGYSGIWVEGDNVTIQGLEIGPNSPGNNKTFEIVANGFALKYSKISVPGGGSVYFGDWQYNAGTSISKIESYTIDHNVFDQGALISVNSGAGYSGEVSGRTITNNVFHMNGATSPAISFTGSGTTVPWFVHPVGGAVITGNSFSGSTQYIRSRGTVKDEDFDWISYWNNNSFDKKVMAGPNPPSQPRGYTYMSGSYSLPNTKRIGAVIQEEIGNAQAGDIVLVGPGTYKENVTVSKSVEIAGAGQGSTTVMPAVSNANPCAGSSLCGGAASNVFLVQADNVKIHDLTVDGDNPALTSGIDRDDADLDARNGIIKNTSGTFNNLEIYNTTVKNIYLRGIYSTGGTFDFHDNTVTNVQGDAYSIAMFAWYGPGIMANNTVSYANDAIAANWSKGIQFLDNTVTNSGSGIHTDNAGSAATTADLIEGNTISDCKPDGYGIFVFVPYIAPTVKENTITNCTVGLSAWGQYNPVTIQFLNNTVTGPAGAAGSVGAYITTDQIGYGYNDVSVNFNGNFITGFETGIYLTADEQSWTPDWTSKTITATFTSNSMSGNATGFDKGATGVYNASATHNWWGDASGPGGFGPGTGDTIAEGVPYAPWLCSGEDTSADPGFQPSSQTDCTPPAISYALDPASPDGSNGWFKSDVTVTWTVTDNESDISSSAGCGPTTISADTPGTTLTCTATSGGGTSSESVTIKRDATPPTLTPTVSPNPIFLYGTATATPNASDGTSGIASASCDPLDTRSVGTHLVTCTAADKAGNTNSVSVSYGVGYNFEGFFSPVDNLPLLNAAKAGQSIPLKWRLTDANGAPILDLAEVTVSVVSLSCSSGTTVDQVEEYADGASGLQNLGDGYYQFNWKTPKSYAGSCKTMKLNLGDGTLRTAHFQFKK